MKDDKENTRQREKRMEIKCENIEKTEKPKQEKKELMTKVTLRHLFYFVSETKMASYTDLIWQATPVLLAS